VGATASIVALLRSGDQAVSLPARNAERPTLAGGHAPVLQTLAGRLDRAFQAVVRRLRTGETPGYQRFRGKGRYDSLAVPQAPVGGRVDTNAKRVRIANVGQVRLLLRRPLKGTPKTATISRSSAGKGDVCFACAGAEPSLLPATKRQVGSDVGLTTFATLSDGQVSAKAHGRLRKEEQGGARAVGARWSPPGGGAGPRAHRLAAGRLHPAAQPSYCERR
jgi:transposase